MKSCLRDFANRENLMFGDLNATQRYLNDIVDPSIANFNATPTDARKALLACMVLADVPGHLYPACGSNNHAASAFTYKLIDAVPAAKTVAEVAKRRALPADLPTLMKAMTDLRAALGGYLDAARRGKNYLDDLKLRRKVATTRAKAKSAEEYDAYCVGLRQAEHAARAARRVAQRKAERLAQGVTVDEIRERRQKSQRMNAGLSVKTDAARARINPLLLQWRREEQKTYAEMATELTKLRVPRLLGGIVWTEQSIKAAMRHAVASAVKARERL